MEYSKYNCFRCNKYGTQKFSDIRYHVCRKTICNQRKDIENVSEDQMLVITLTPIYNEKHTINLSDLKHLNGSTIINRNKEELFAEIIYIEKNRIKTCKYCNEEFNLICDLKRHLIMYCFHNKLLNDNKVTTTNINESYNVNNSYNTNNTNYNYNNNINLNIGGVKPPIPFEEKWDLSHLSIEKQLAINCSENMYSTLLKEILINDINNNIIINSNHKTGKVYMNHHDKYVNMKCADIADKTMEKLKIQLSSTNKHLVDIDDIRYIIYKTTDRCIRSKYNSYVDDKSIRDKVIPLICGIYESKYSVSLEQSNNVMRIEESRKHEQEMKEQEIFSKKYSNYDYDSESESDTDDEKLLDKISADKI